MRGGTSKGVFFRADALPADRAQRDRLLLRVIGSPDPYGKQIDGLGAATSSTQDIDLTARIVSMGKLHHAMTGTGAVAIAVASAIPGTIVQQSVRAGASNGLVRFGHPSGTLSVGAQEQEKDGAWAVTKAVMSRSARRLMEGWVRVPGREPPRRP